MAQRIVTLDFSSTAIRLLETIGNRVARWAVAPLEPGVLEDGAIVDPKALGAIIRQLMRSSGIKARKVVVSISGLYAVSRTLRLAAPRGGLPDEVVLQAVQKLMPVPEDALYLSWQTLAVSEDEQQVFVVGMPKNRVDDVVRALKSAGLAADALDVKALALARAVDLAEALILNMEPSSVDIVVVAVGRIQVMRTILQGTNLTAEERGEQTARALNSAVRSHNSLHPHNPISTSIPLFLSGQMATEPALVTTLQATMPYPIQPIATSMEYPAHFPLLPYAVNIGLALRKTTKAAAGSGFASIDVNIMSATYHRRKLSPRQLYTIAALLLAVALLVPLLRVNVDVMDKVGKLRGDLTRLEQRMQLRQAEVSRRADIVAAVQEYQAIRGKRGSFLQDLETIDSEAKKLGIQMKTVSHEGKEVTISVPLTDFPSFEEYRRALDGFSAALVQTGKFASATYNPLQFPPAGTMDIKAKPSP